MSENYARVPMVLPDCLMCAVRQLTQGQGGEGTDAVPAR